MRSRELVFETIGGELRSCYRQNDGSTILADECVCFEDRWCWNCPIDRHAIAARMRDVETITAGEIRRADPRARPSRMRVPSGRIHKPRGEAHA